MSSNFEKHLDVYENRYELYQDEGVAVYYQGFQDKDTQERYSKINSTLSNGYLERIFKAVSSTDFSELSLKNKGLLKNMVDGITSEVGRALVGLAFLQLTIKSICPEQSVRLHKGTTRKGSFSWVKGISMRTIDSTYNTPFLREKGLLNLNKFGLFMTRSLAENYPYSSLYKAEMRGPFEDWIAIVDAIENGEMPAKLGLSYMMALLQNRSDRFHELANVACQLTEKFRSQKFASIKLLVDRFVNETNYSARAFEVVMHSFFQAMQELGFLDECEVIPMSQMRSANKKHGNVGDIELAENKIIIEAWDAKYGKPYLRDELEELRDKLLSHPEVKVAGFVVDSDVDRRNDIITRSKEIELETSTEIKLFSFSEWVDYETKGLSQSQKDLIAYRWIVAIVESFAQRRLALAPIDEPCDEWLIDLINAMNGYKI